MNIIQKNTNVTSHANQEFGLKVYLQRTISMCISNSYTQNSRQSHIINVFLNCLLLDMALIPTVGWLDSNVCLALYLVLQT